VAPYNRGQAQSRQMKYCPLSLVTSSQSNPFPSSQVLIPNISLCLAYFSCQQKEYTHTQTHTHTQRGRESEVKYCISNIILKSWTFINNDMTHMAVLWVTEQERAFSNSISRRIWGTRFRSNQCLWAYTGERVVFS
jgi:hypothetical protein